MAGYQIDQHHGAAGGLDHVATDDLLARVIGAFDQHRGPHALDQFERRSSSKTTTRSTASSAAITSARPSAGLISAGRYPSAAWSKRRC